MDPLTAKVAAAAAPKSLQGLKWAIRKVRLSGVIDPTWATMPIPGRPAPELNANDIVDWRAFLLSPRVQPILALLVTTVMANPSDDESIGTIKETMNHEATRWSLDHENNWRKSFEELWDSLELLFSSELPSCLGREELQQEFDDFLDFAGGGVLGSNDHRSRLISLAKDVDLLLRAASAATQVAAAVRDGSLPSIIAHTDVDEPPEFAKLYVPRELHDRQTGDTVPADHLTAAGQGFRFVLLGNPGAGKSTFVQHLSWELAQGVDDQPSQPALIVKCREYASKAWTTAISEYIANQARAELGVTVEPVAISDGLVLGKYVVIFDGLDEITDVSTRSDFCNRVERFAANYPFTSILVTSREVGYTRAPINPAKFNHLSLREFTDNQVRTYVENWFTLRNLRELIEPFMIESLTVVDLRSNPLLLSLLCILYRARGAIPRRRRDIYGKCADLLFNTWDSHRQIEQPEELPAYGQRLMQEIARWVYSSPTAQNGLEQRVVEKVIATYLESVGVTEDQARQRSHEFLEFCAGRAWLLGSFGTNDYGDKIFNFTHRTFYEYFTAEAMSRLATSAERLSTQITDAYMADATSVLPELLVQAYDERVERGGAELFKLIADGSNDAALILRLMNGSLLPAKVRTRGFEKVLQLWRRSPEKFDEQGFDALFSLDPNALTQFKQQFLDATSSVARNFFARGWALAVLDGRTHIFSKDVADMAEAVGDQLVAAGDYLPDDALLNWLALRGDIDIDPNDLNRFLAVAETGRVERVGAAWIIVSTAAAAGGAVPPRLVQAILRAARYGHFGQLTLRTLGAAMTKRAQSDAAVFHSELPLRISVKADRDLYAALMAIALALAEVGVRPGWFVPRVLGISGTIDDMEEVRRAALSKENVLVGRDVQTGADRAASVLPPWARRWIQADSNLVRAPLNEPENLDSYIFG